jgi:DNA modification methylase
MIVIVKNNIGMGYGFRNQHELCWVCEKGKVTYDDAGFSNVQRMENISHDKETHPHQKGIELLARMIKHSSKVGDTVLDCFAGSGSVCVAAKMCDRNYIGCELDEKYAEMGNDRITAISSSLF